MSERLKFERFVWFHGQVKRLRYPNSRGLVEEFEISERTAQRDIDFMRDRLLAPLAFDRLHNGYRYTDDAYEIPIHWLDEDNLLALALAARLASTIPDTAVKEDLCRLIVRALFDDCSLHITYRSPHSGAVSERTVQPLHLMHYMGSWHLLAWCATKAALRDFALARLQAVAVADKPLRLPDTLPPIKEYTRRHFGIMQGETATTVTLRFSPHIAPAFLNRSGTLTSRPAWNPTAACCSAFPLPISVS